MEENGKIKMIANNIGSFRFSAKKQYLGYIQNVSVDGDNYGQSILAYDLADEKTVSLLEQTLPILKKTQPATSNRKWHDRSDADILFDFDFAAYDGKKITYARSDGVWLKDIASQKTKHLLPNHYGAHPSGVEDKLYTDLFWQSAGNYLLARLSFSESSKLQLYSLDDKKLIILPDALAYDTIGFINAHGNKIFYSQAGPVGNNVGLWIDTKKIIDQSIVSAASSSQGQIAAIIEPDTFNENKKTILPFKTRGLYLVDLKGNLTPLLENEKIFSVSWSPDGNYLFFLENLTDQRNEAEDNQSILMMLTVDGKNKKEVINGLYSYTL
jgi:dipeptidyl aminopeptidase/acylaminoacyl peptidase